MRKTLLSLLLVASGAIGLAGSTASQAQDRVYVRSGDVVFSYGRPYWRHDPGIRLHVGYERGYPRYYHYRGPGYVRHHEPRWRDRHWRSGRGYGPRYYGYDRPYRYRDYDRGVVIEYRDWD